jgi:hypothetical protein
MPGTGERPRESAFPAADLEDAGGDGLEVCEDECV